MVSGPWSLVQRLRGPRDFAWHDVRKSIGGNIEHPTSKAERRNGRERFRGLGVPVDVQRVDSRLRYSSDVASLRGDAGSGGNLRDAGCWILDRNFVPRLRRSWLRRASLFHFVTFALSSQSQILSQVPLGIQRPSRSCSHSTRSGGPVNLSFQSGSGSLK